MEIISVILLLLSIFLFIERSKKLKKRKNEIEYMKKQIDALSRWKTILDAEAKAAEIIADAETKAAAMTAEATSKYTSEIQNIDSQKSLAMQESEAMKVKANNTLFIATKEADRIIRNAEDEAKKIAGDAYTAMNKAAEFEQTAKAMKNIIEGYGNQYLKPVYSLLDDLAEDYAHTEPGDKLKAVRQYTQMLIKTKDAATCNYVETIRKETAINFVLDAFNGKVDSILSKVKKDNFGTLERKIFDAFRVVNHNGTPFKNAAITQRYLDARLAELKWAVVVNELKWQEQEEQRRIREQIRAEEKARREYEKAMRDAQKEEEVNQKAMAKVRAEMEKANVDQHDKYEEKLLELEAKLKEAEEKNQRALSMAQQTKSGNVYIISNIGSFGENVYKIGLTRRLEPLDRVKELGDASVPFSFDVHAMIYSENAPKLETQLHRTFIEMQMNKVNPRKEFFRVTLADIKTEIEKLGLQTKWTMVAEATEYRESLAIEKEITSDETKHINWKRHQMEFEEDFGPAMSEDNETTSA